MSGKPPKFPKRLLVAGGGTGGHVLAGVSIADRWKIKIGPEAQILFVGAQGGWEEKLVPRSGYSLEVLKLGALNRVSRIEKLKTLFKLPFALFKSLFLILKFKPDAIIGVGGYASGPVVLIGSFFGRVLGLKTFVLEQNSVPGLTNRILGRFVNTVFCAFPGSELSFKGTPVIVTGNPIRSNMMPMPPAPQPPFTVFIFGGSQGAMGINSLILEALPRLESSDHAIELIHQTGEKDFERVKIGYEASKISHRVEKFIYEMAETYQRASLLICRAGSSTLSEVAAVGRASILVPLPTAADNHQEKNAQVFVEQDAAILFPQGPARGGELADLILKLARDPARIEAMEKKVRQFYRATSAEDIVTSMQP